MQKVLVDTNVILRCLLRDIDEQAHKADEIIRNGAWTLPEVLMETSHVLRTFYKVERKDIAKQLFKALKLIEVERPALMFRAVEIFAETRLDFVDCILAAHHELENAEVFTFDDKLRKQLEREEK